MSRYIVIGGTGSNHLDRRVALASVLGSKASKNDLNMTVLDTHLVFSVMIPSTVYFMVNITQRFPELYFNVLKYFSLIRINLDWRSRYLAMNVLKQRIIKLINSECAISMCTALTVNQYIETPHHIFSVLLPTVTTIGSK